MSDELPEPPDDPSADADADASPSAGQSADAPAASPRPAAERGAWLIPAAASLVMLAYLTWRDIGIPAYDDAYFFKRFALNALEHGVYAWNIEDGPVYGATSQAFQLLATLAAALSPTYYVAVIKIASAAALGALGLLLMRWSERTTDPGRGSMIVLLMLGSPLVLTTAITGMETAVTLLALGLVLTVMVRPDGSMPMSPRAAAVATVVIYLFRPDAALLPAVAYCVPPLLRRQWPQRYPLTLGGLWAYYGTPLPLSFFMKTSALQPYGASVASLGLSQKQMHFGAALVFAAPLLWIAGHRRDPANLALLASVAALWAYHLLLTNEIMGYRGRFYIPAMVPLCMAAARGDQALRQRGRSRATLGLLLGLGLVIAGAYAARWIPTSIGDYQSRVPWPCYLGLVGGAAWLLRPGRSLGPRPESGIMAAIMIAALLGWQPPVKNQLRTDAQLIRVYARQVTTVRGLFDVTRCLPDARNVYHSELGATGLVLLRTRVVDLVGILSDHVLWGETFDDICERDRPEAIFLPHHNYRELNSEIRQSECIASYRRVVEQSASPLYVRRDLADGFLQCATDVHQWRR